MKKIFQLIFLLLATQVVLAQSNPSDPPLVKSTKYVRYGWIQADSGTIIMNRDTGFVPRWAGTIIFWQHAGVDTSYWFYTGARWTKVGVGDGVGSVTTVTATNANGFTWTITNPTTIPNLSLSLQNAAADGTTKGQATFTASDFNAVSGLVSLDYANMQVVSGSQPGILSTTLYNTFNGKENVLTFNTPLTRATNSISINNAAADATNKGVSTYVAADFNATNGVVSIDYTNGQKASATQPGFLTATDWISFSLLDSIVVTNAGTSGFPIIYVNTSGDTLFGKRLRGGSGISITQETDSSLTIAAVGGVGGYSTIMDEGVAVTQRSTFNFIGANVAATDNGGSSRTDVTFSAASNSSAGYVSLGNQKLGTGEKYVDNLAVGTTTIAGSATAYITRSSTSNPLLYWKNTGTGDADAWLESDSRGYALRVTGSASSAGVLSIVDRNASTTRLSISTAGAVAVNDLGSSGDKIVYSNNSGTLGKVTVGAGLSFSSGTLTATATSITVKDSLGWIRFSRFGMIGDNSTDNVANFNALLALGYRVFFVDSGTYKFASTITLPAGTKLFGMGANSIIKISVNDTLFKLSNYCEINNIRFEGTRSGGASTAQTALSLDSVLGCHVYANYFYNFGGAAIYGRANGLMSGSDFTYGNKVDENSGDHNQKGIYLDTRAEYFTNTNNTFVDGDRGIVITGGNNSIVGGNYSTNVIGIEITSGSNNAHATATGVTANHCSTASVSISGVTLGYDFVSCNLYYGGVTIVSSTDIHFNKCQVDVTGSTITSTNNTNLFFWDCKFYSSPTWTITGTTPSVAGMSANQALVVTDVGHSNKKFEFGQLDGVGSIGGTSTGGVSTGATQVDCFVTFRGKTGGADLTRDMALGSLRIDVPAGSSITDNIQFYYPCSSCGTRSTFAILDKDANYAMRSMPTGLTAFGNNNAPSAVVEIATDADATLSLKVTGPTEISAGVGLKAAYNSSSAGINIGVSNYNSGSVTSIDINSGTSNNPITAASGTVSQLATMRINQTTRTSTNSNVTNSIDASLWIVGAPIASTNTTITEAWSLYVQAGKSEFNDEVWVLQRASPQSGDFGVKIDNSNVIQGVTYTSSWAEGTLNLNPSGSDVIIAGLASVGNFRSNGYMRFTTQIGGDANYTVSATDYFINLSATLTAGRNFILPSALAGRQLVVWNQNSSGNAWTFTGRTVVDGAGATVTTMTNDKVYTLIDDGTNYVVVSIGP